MIATTYLDEGFGVFHCFNNSLVGDQAPVVQKLDSAIHRINHYPTNCAIQWIVIYPVGSVIHPLNNWDQLRRSLSVTFAECTLPFPPCGSILLSDHWIFAFWEVAFGGFDFPISERLRAHSSGFESVLSGVTERNDQTRQKNYFKLSTLTSLHQHLTQCFLQLMIFSIGLLWTVNDVSKTCAVVIFRVKVSCITSVDSIKLWLLI